MQAAGKLGASDNCRSLSNKNLHENNTLLHYMLLASDMMARRANHFPPSHMHHPPPDLFTPTLLARATPYHTTHRAVT